MTEVIHEAVADAVAMAQAACIENMQMLLEQQHSSSASSDSGRSDHSDCPSDDALRPKGSRSRTHPHISTRTYHTINSPNTGVGGGTGPYARSHAQTHVLGSSHPHRGRAEVKTGKKEKKGKGTRVRARGSGSNAGTSHRTHPRQYASSDHSQVRMDGPDYFNPTGNHGNFPL
ncbi:hypothetical protein SARC_10142 [Sphaeroforma arctica JP610]|uniref:Uncharacterized protein n=1 Tax=Sphaeroforma arctica JP610 TaxID=667725 RepID=A0A0L0FKT3_9EUKA|nr:hypothetical protein SARC_10142 [Sphaeroforma arctica JP610]KNC77397.1 hypothetical protein SARC_10142 [Sphaeroforma arctica JP610]|eukprot:XP_014151299.1 hypothetical protein SARC_10142 [Sphaeroforma arctica JP610]